MDQDLAAIHFFLDRASDPSDLRDAFDGPSETLADLAARLCVLEAARIGDVSDAPAFSAAPVAIATADRAALDDRPLTEDATAFGRTWVYCRQHQAAHETGWCTVSPSDKLGLGVETAAAAQEKCRDFSLVLHRD